MKSKTKEIVWKDVREEAADILSRYVRIVTVNPPGDEEKGAKFLQGLLKAEGIASTIYYSAKRRANVMARVKGADPKGLILLSHIDTVGAEAENWDFDPFGGERKKGFVLGRGTLDDKGMGVMELVALLLIKRSGIALKRDVVFLATADEEVGGEYGAAYMAKTHADKLRAAYLLNEGGAVMKGFLPEGRAACTVAVGEKGPLWIEMSRKGTSGHGSMPVADNAILALSRALVRLAGHKRPVRFTDETIEFCAGLGGGMGGIKGTILKGVRLPLVRRGVARLLMKTPNIAAMLTDTISLTTTRAGIKENVIPDEARATIDVRLLPGTDKKEFIAWLSRALGDEKISIKEVFASPPSLSSADGEFFGAVRDVTRELSPDAVTIPMVSTAFTDSRFFREIGIPSYGLLPAPLTTGDIQSIHGKNERIGEEGLLFGTKYIYHLIKRLCA
jgi:acetylornithine deacetylase/succinyl-diaminopimelate desuccinylase-like protein